MIHDIDIKKEDKGKTSGFSLVILLILKSSVLIWWCWALFFLIIPCWSKKMATVQYVRQSMLQLSLHFCHSANHDLVSRWPRSSRVHWRRFVTHLSGTFSLFSYSYLDLVISCKPESRPWLVDDIAYSLSHSYKYYIINFAFNPNYYLIYMQAHC